MDLRSLSCSGEDRISNLTDDLIHHILSFVDMKYAVQTCLLSKRWSEIWISLPFLNFDTRLYLADNVQSDNDDVGRNRDLGFIDFVKMVFFLRDNSDIIRFRLFLDETFSGDPDNLILAALRHNVQELDITNDMYIVDEDFELPRQVFTCKSLRKLKLYTRGYVYPTFYIPKSVSLHQLNSLILDGFVIPTAESFNSLCSSCPLLELRIINCSFWDDVFDLTIDSLCLQTLEIDWVGVPSGSIIKLNAPNITSFICKDAIIQECSLGNLSSLVTADVTMSLARNEKDETVNSYLELCGETIAIYGKPMMGFLGGIDNVKDLKLSSGFLEVLSKALGQLDCQPPKFCNLQHLELKVWFTRGCMQATTYLLKISPNIKSLVLALKESGLPDIGLNWEAGLPCTLSKLRYVEIREVEGCDNELKLLGFLLESAVVLEEVALLFRSTVGSPERVRQVRRFRDQLRALPRASSSINIIVF